MAEGAEVEERVDLDEDNYMEEMDDDVEEQIDEDGVDGGSDENVEEHAEEAHEDPATKASDTDHPPEPDESHSAGESVEDGEKPSAPVNEEEKEKHTQLLALPPYGSEVFIGGLSKDTSEEDLRDLCDEIGEIIEVRLMQDRETGESKGYAFIGFKTKEVAQNAIEELHSKVFKGKTLRCSLSETKHRLFIGNVPKIWTEDEFRKVIDEVGPGVEHIELIKAIGKSQLKLIYHTRAEFTTEHLGCQRGQEDHQQCGCLVVHSSSCHSIVKALYVKNIPENTSTEKLKELFQHHGEVTKVVMPPGKGGQGKRDFGFVHFAERASALKAVKDTEKYEIDGHPLEVVLAKPQTEKKPDGAYPYNAGPHANHLAHPGYGGGFGGNPYGSVGAGYGVAGGFQQPMIYGRGPMPAGMHMVPMVLPDGRIGYVLQQPGVQMPTPRPRRADRSNVPGSHPGRGGGGSDEGHRGGRRYRPY
ncbi:hypothetical protein C1H46_043573 [Malus baccata]|uniref:RRM domain-containing protein n=1 Tax=Malus baccata TaxID=106549 RepID=A0A540K9I8_MALBA|nr:hypothetical protein C1H46_043573 [Malus baccata]